MIARAWWTPILRPEAASRSLFTQDSRAGWAPLFERLFVTCKRWLGAEDQIRESLPDDSFTAPSTRATAVSLHDLDMCSLSFLRGHPSGPQARRTGAAAAAVLSPPHDRPTHPVRWWPHLNTQETKRVITPSRNRKHVDTALQLAGLRRGPSGGPVPHSAVQLFVVEASMFYLASSLIRSHGSSERQVNRQVRSDPAKFPPKWADGSQPQTLSLFPQYSAPWKGVDRVLPAHRTGLDPLHWCVVAHVVYCAALVCFSSSRPGSFTRSRHGGPRSQKEPSEGPAGEGE